MEELLKAMEELEAGEITEKEFCDRLKAAKDANRSELLEKMAGTPMSDLAGYLRSEADIMARCATLLPGSLGASFAGGEKAYRLVADALDRILDPVQGVERETAVTE